MPCAYQMRPAWRTHAVVVCSSMIRAGLRRFFAAKFPELAFLSYEELPPKIEIVPTGAVPSLQ